MSTSNPPPMPSAQYVDFGGNLVWPLPARCDGLRLDGFFFLPPSLPALQRLCDRVFSDPTSGAVSWAPLPLLFVTFGEYARSYSEVPGYRERGAVKYAEVALWMYLVAKEDIAPNIPRGSVAVFVPYIWVDDQYPQVGGREMLGIPKGTGRFTMPRFDDDPGLWALDTVGIPKFAPDAIAESGRLLSVRRTDAATAGEPVSIWNSFVHAVDGVRAALTQPGDDRPLRNVADLLSAAERDLDVAADIAGALVKQSIPTVALRQFRDSTTEHGAIAQAVLYFEAGMENLTGRLLPGDYQLTVAAWDSHPIARELGVTGTLSALGVHLEMDLLLPSTQELWRAP